MALDITKPLDTDLARLLPYYIRETREAIMTMGSRFPEQKALAANTATPSVDAGILFKTSNTVPTTITYLEGGFPGQVVFIIADDANTSIAHTPGAILLESGDTITFNANQGIILVCHENFAGNKLWIQVGGIGAGGSGAGNAKFYRDTYTVPAGGQASFTTLNTYEPGNNTMLPYVNGELQPRSKFTEVDNNTIEFTETLAEGTFVELLYITALSIETTINDLLVVNKPYTDVRQYTSFSEAIADSASDNKVIVVSESCPVVGTLLVQAAKQILIIAGGSLQVASGFDITFEGSVTLEAGSSIVMTNGDVTFNGGLTCNGGVVNNIDATGSTSINGPFTCGLYQCFDGAGTVTFGSGAVAEVYPEWWGAVANGATNYTATVQSALDSLPSVGGLCQISDGIKFDIKGLTFPQRSNMSYRVDDDISSPAHASDLGAGERVLFSANSSYPSNPSGGIVNEWRATASFHPGHIVDVRKDIGGHSSYLGPGQSLTNPVRASYNIHDEQIDSFRIVYQNYDTFSNFSGIYLHACRRVLTLTGIGTAAWSSVPAENTVITGATSGAKGFLLSVESTATLVLWFSGEFIVGEALTDDNETSSAVISNISFAIVPLQSLATDLKRGNWAVGLPPGAARDLFAVAGKIGSQKTRNAGQYIDETINHPGYVWVDSYESTTPNGFEIIYNTTAAAASRRLTLRKYDDTNDQANIGACRAHTSFNDGAVKATSSFNVTSITKNTTGDYTVNFTTAFPRADFAVCLTTSDPNDYAYVYVRTVSVLRIRVVTPGSTTLKNLAGILDVVCFGGDI